METVAPHAGAWIETLHPRDLAESLRFEFNLPYPDGKRMGLVRLALDAFSKRLGLSLEDA